MKQILPAIKKRCPYYMPNCLKTNIFLSLFLYCVGVQAQITVDNISRQCNGNKYDLTFTVSGAPIILICQPPIQCAFYFSGYTVIAPQPYGVIKEDCYNAFYYNPGIPCNFSNYVCACNGVTYNGPDCAENAGYLDYSFGECTGTESVQFTIKNISSGNGVAISIEAATASTLNYTFPPYTCSCPPFSMTASSNSPRCTGATLQLQASATNITSWQWSGPGGFTSTQQNPTRSNAIATYSGVYTVTATKSPGCTGTATVQATVLNPIQISNVISNNLSGSFIVSGGLPQNNGSNYSTLTMTLQGNPGMVATLTGLPVGNGGTVGFTCPQAGVYDLVVGDGGGCLGSAVVTVTDAGSGGGGNGSGLPAGDCWTWQNPLPQGNGYYDIRFINTQLGFRVGYYGLIEKTTNGGQDWTVQNSGIKTRLYSVFFVNTQIGWVVGEGGIILVTVDGGQTWKPQNSGTTKILFSAFFVDSQTGWIAGDAGLILKTVDGGKNWFTKPAGSTARLFNVQFINSLTGWVVGSGGTILKSTDGGEIWAPQNSGTTLSLYTAYFIDSQTGWAGGNNQPVLKTTNGGQSWVVQNSVNLIFNINSMFFINSQIGWVSGVHNFGYATILKTTDGGQTWITQFSKTPNDLEAVYFIDSQTGWAVGRNGGAAGLCAP